MSRLKIEEAGISNSLIFAKVMENEGLCRTLLEILLKIKIERLEYPEPEKLLEGNPGFRGIRVDVYVKETGPGGEVTRMYDIEMQTTDEKDLPRRVRYYQGMMDGGILGKGKPYGGLPESFIIFICTRDPFGKGLPLYTVESVIAESPGVKYNDGTHHMFFNCAAYGKMADPDIKAFLEYVATRKVDSGFAHRLDMAVKEAKESGMARRDFMTLEEYATDIARELIAPDMAREMAQDMAKDMAQDMAKDMAQDMAQTMVEDAAEGTALNLLRLGVLDAGQIASATGVPESRVRELEAGLSPAQP